MGFKNTHYSLYFIIKIKLKLMQEEKKSVQWFSQQHGGSLVRLTCL